MHPSDYNLQTLCIIEAHLGEIEIPVLRKIIHNL